LNGCKICEFIRPKNKQDGSQQKRVHDDRKVTAIIGDYMIKNIQGYKLSTQNHRCMDMEDYIKHFIKLKLNTIINIHHHRTI